VKIFRFPKGLRAHDTLSFYLFASPWIIGCLVFTLGPMFASLYLSFTNYSVLSPTKFVGLTNYADMLGNKTLGVSIFNTTYYSLLAVPFGVIMALVLAILLNNKQLLGRSFFRTAFYLPSVMPVVALSVLWILMLQPQYGFVNAFLGLFGIHGPNWLGDPDWVKAGFVLMTLTGIGPNMVILLAALQGVPVHLYEAAALDGAGEFQKFRHITVPMISPAIFFTIIIGFISSFQVFTQSFIMTEGGPNNASLFYVLYLFRQAFRYYNMGFASAMAWLLFLIIITLSFIQFKLSSKWVHYYGD
jgi:multiple sugar transport system permease protein